MYIKVKFKLVKQEAAHPPALTYPLTHPPHTFPPYTPAMDDNGLVSSLLLSPGHLVYQVNHAGSASGSTILWPRHEVKLLHNTGSAG